MTTMYNEPDDIRFEFFIKQTATNKVVWSLQAKEGLFAIMEDANGQHYVPLWPDENSARQYASAEWTEYTPESMEIKEFFSWLYELKDDEMNIAVFPNSPDKIIPIDALTLLKYIKAELSKKE